MRSKTNKQGSFMGMAVASIAMMTFMSTPTANAAIRAPAPVTPVARAPIRATPPPPIVVVPPCKRGGPGITPC